MAKDIKADRREPIPNRSGEGQRLFARAQRILAEVDEAEAS
jgi:DNA-binding transcriptional LysR family regulator